MKIIYLHQYFVFPEGSGGTRSFDLATSFVKKGHEVDIITSSAFIKTYKFNKRWTTLERNGLNVHVLKLDYDNKLSSLSRIVTFVKFLWFATIKLLNIKGDIVLATSTPLTIGIPALFKKWIFKTPYVFEVRDVWPEAVISIGAIKNKYIQRLLFFLEKTLYRNALAVVPLSSDMRNSIVHRYPEFEEKTEIVIENISEIVRFQNPAIDAISLKEVLGVSPRFSILYAGTFGKVNGIEYVVNLATKTFALDPTIVFILIGDGAEKQNLKEIVQKRGLLNKNIFFIDPISKAVLPNWYAATNMGSSFVTNIPELWYNSANKFFDTLASGKPILINYGGWQSGVIERNNLGYVLPPELNNEVIRDFVNYTQNPELHKTQGNNALSFAIKEYSLEAAVKKYLTIFKDL